MGSSRINQSFPPPTLSEFSVEIMEESLSNLLWLLFKFKLLRKEAGDKRWKPNIYDFPQTLTIASTLSFRKVQGIAVSTAKNICCSSNWNASRWGRGSEWAENRKLIKETSETAIRRELSKNLRRQGWEEHAADLRSDLRSKNIHTAAFALRVFSLSLPPLFLPLNFPTFHLCFPFYLWTFQLSTFVSLSTFELSTFEPGSARILILTTTSIRPRGWLGAEWLIDGWLESMQAKVKKQEMFLC